MAGEKVEAPNNPVDRLLSRKPLEGFVQGSPRTKVEKVDRRPHASGLGPDPVEDAALQVERLTSCLTHLSTIIRIFRTNIRGLPKIGPNTADLQSGNCAQ